MHTNPSPSSASSHAGKSTIPTEPTDNDIFTDPAITRAVVEDPLFRWLHQSWRTLLTVVVAAVLGSYAWNQFKLTEQDRFAEYAELYQRAGQQFEDVVEKSKELQKLRASSVVMDEATQAKLTEAEKAVSQSKLRLQDTLAALGDTSAPYTDFASLYRGLSEVAAGDKEKALSTLTLGDWRAAAQEGKPNLASELAALARARVLIDQDDTFTQGWDLLKSLATGSKYVFAGAMVTLSRVARTNEERAEAQRVLQEVREARPAQAELLDQAVSKL